MKKQIRILLITPNPPKLLINPNGRALQQQIAPMLSREKWDECMMARAREWGEIFVA
jgi:hypothetical protein